MRRRIGGFTLLELLVVIAIIMLLMTIGFMSMESIFELVYRVKCASQLHSVTVAYTTYVSQYSKIYPPIWSHSEGAGGGDNSNYASWYFPQNSYQFNPWGQWWSCGFGPLMWHKLITAKYFVCPSIADNTDDWWHDAPDDDLEVWNYYLTNPHPAKMLREYNVGQSGGPSTRSTYNIRPYMYPWTPAQLSARGVRAILADNLSTPQMVIERHGNGVNVAYMDGAVEWRTDRILWENDMTPNYVPHHPTMTEVWETLDYAR